MWMGKSSSGLMINTDELIKTLRTMERERKALEYVERQEKAKKNSKRWMIGG